MYMFVLCSVFEKCNWRSEYHFSLFWKFCPSLQPQARRRNIFSSNVNDKKFRMMTTMMTKMSEHLSWLCSIAECYEFVFLFFSEFMCMCWYTWSLLFYNWGRMGRDSLLDQIPVRERSILDCSFLIQPGSIQTALYLNFAGSAQSQSYPRGRWQGEKQSWGHFDLLLMWAL